MIDIAALRALVKAGATAEMLLAAIEASQAEETKKLETRRAKDAERQRRRRVRIGHAESHGVTLTVCDPPVHILPPSKNSEPKKVLRSTAKTLADDWQLSEADRAYSRSKGWSDEKTESEGERFKNHALAGGRKQRDWAAAWRNWVTSPYQKPSRDPPANGHTNAKDQKRQEWHDAYQELKRSNRARESEESGGDVVRFLPASGR